MKRIKKWITKNIDYYTVIILILIPFAGIGSYYIANDWLNLSRIDFEYLFRTLSSIILILGFIVAVNQLKLNSEKNKKERGQKEIDLHYNETNLKIEDFTIPPLSINHFIIDPLDEYLQVDHMYDDAPSSIILDAIKFQKLKHKNIILTPSDITSLHKDFVNGILHSKKIPPEIMDEIHMLLGNGESTNNFSNKYYKWYFYELTTLSNYIKYVLGKYSNYIGKVEAKVEAIMNDNYLQSDQKQALLYDVIRLNLLDYIKIVNHNINYPVFLPVQTIDRESGDISIEIKHSSNHYAEIIYKPTYLLKILKKEKRIISKIKDRYNITTGTYKEVLFTHYGTPACWKNPTTKDKAILI